MKIKPFVVVSEQGAAHTADNPNAPKVIAGTVVIDTVSEDTGTRTRGQPSNTPGGTPPLAGEVKKLAGTIVDITLTGADGKSITQGTNISLELGYSDGNLPTGASEDDLILTSYDEKEKKWVEEPTSQVDKTNNKVKGNIKHLTIFGVIAKQPQELFISENQRYYPARNKHVSFGFLDAYIAGGGSPRYGLPLTNEITLDGRTVQWFDKARMEYRWENGAIVVAPIGQEFLTLIGSMHTPSTPLTPDSQLNGDALYFPSTGENVVFELKRHYEANGGDAAFGVPLTAELTDGQGGTVQYFQNARLHWTAAEGVTVGSLGADLFNTLRTAGR